MHSSQKLAGIVCVALLISPVPRRPTAAGEPSWPEDRPRAKVLIRAERNPKLTDVDSTAASRPRLDREYVAASEDGDLSSPARESKGDSSADDSDKRTPKRPPRPPKTLFRWSYAPDEEEDDEVEEVEPLATDRPDFTEASSTVGKGVLQIETGYTFIEDRKDGVVLQDHSWGEALMRYGILADWLELRLGVFLISERSTDEGSTSGVEDLYLGVKLALTEQSGWWPEMALTPQATVPTGSSHFQNYSTLIGVNWLYGWDINDSLAIGGSTQVNKAVDEELSTYAEFAQSWTINYTLTEQLGAYTEWFALVPSGTQLAETEHYFDGGFTFKFTKDVQWDVRGGIGLNDAAADYFVGTGLAVRCR